MFTFQTRYFSVAAATMLLSTIIENKKCSKSVLRKQKVLKIGFLQYKLNANVFFGDCLHLECIVTAKTPQVAQKNAVLLMVSYSSALQPGYMVHPRVHHNCLRGT